MCTKISDTLRCSNIIKQINNHANKGGLLTSDIGLKNGATSRSCCFCLDRLWAWMKGVSYDKNEVAKSINIAFQGVNLSHLQVSEVELATFCKNINQLNLTFEKGNKFDRILIKVITAVSTHVLQKKPTRQGLPAPKVKPQGAIVNTGPMDGELAARPNLKDPIHTIGLRGIPNHSDNCFLISTYQLVKNNPTLYDAIFNSQKFKNDKSFAALREFDRKYDSKDLLTKDDMERVRKNCLSKFEIPARGHQDAEEVLTAALFKYVESQNFMQSTSILEFTIPASSINAVVSNIIGAKVVSVKVKTDGRYALRVQKQFNKDQAGNILNLPLKNMGDKVEFEKVFEMGFQKEGATSLEDGDYTVELSSGDQISKGQQIERETVFSAGKSVTISFKRFEWQRYGNGGAPQKIKTRVIIPSGGHIQLDKRDEPHVVKGFVVHQGECSYGGHYVEYQKIENQWYLNDDGCSNPVSTEVALLKMEDAYILQAEKF